MLLFKKNFTLPSYISKSEPKCQINQSYTVHGPSLFIWGKSPRTNIGSDEEPTMYKKTLRFKKDFIFFNIIRLSPGWEHPVGHAPCAVVAVVVVVAVVAFDGPVSPIGSGRLRGWM